MKSKIFFSVFISSLFLVGCSLSTPMGTLTISFDKNTKSDNVVYEDENGNKQEFDTQDISGQIDNMLDDVDLHNGVSNEELKNFVHENMDSLGVSDTITELENSLNTTINEVESSVENDGVVDE